MSKRSTDITDTNSNTNTDPEENAPNTGASGTRPAGRSNKLLLLVVGIVVLIIGIIIGYESGASSPLNLCVYGIPNTTNSSQLDGVDAFKVILANATFNELNTTVVYCYNFSATQNATIASELK